MNTEEPTTRPIPFTSAMVSAILKGEKTQTRRLAKEPPLAHPGAKKVEYSPWCSSDFNWLAKDFCGNVIGASEVDAFTPPKGLPGDRLWVREDWKLPAHLDSLSGRQVGETLYAPVYFVADGYKRRPLGMLNSSNDEVPCWACGWSDGESEPGRFRVGRFMPRWASRIVLELEGVALERLNGLTEANALEEGVSSATIENVERFGLRGWPVSEWQLTAVGAFKKLWDSINAKRQPWDSNPWVWAYRFRLLECEDVVIANG